MQTADKGWLSPVWEIIATIIFPFYLSFDEKSLNKKYFAAKDLLLAQSLLKKMEVESSKIPISLRWDSMYVLTETDK